MLDQRSKSQGVHPLDHPIWTALTTRQGQFAEGDGPVRRYHPHVAPFAATADHSANSFAALRSLIAATSPVALFTTEPLTPPSELNTMVTGIAEQMIGIVSDASVKVPEIISLGSSDVPAMMELNELTKPGPFSARTHELGSFFGIRVGNQLVAMAGERMKLDGYTEITAVCTHPAFRGRGYAQALLVAISSLIVARGETPFLHVFSDNTPAISLYRRMGLNIRRRMYLTVLSNHP